MKVHHFVPPLKNPWLYLEKSIVPQDKIFHAHVHNAWLIMDSWWTIVLWSGTLKADAIGSVSSFVDLYQNISLAYTWKDWLPWKCLVQLSELEGNGPPGYAPVHKAIGPDDILVQVLKIVGS